VDRVHRVLVAIDFAEPARELFDHAVALSRVHDAELTVVHAVPTGRPFNWDAAERSSQSGLLRRAAEAAGVPFDVSIQQGDPAGVILLHANARRADLIVLGTSRRSGLDRFRFGSVAETVARKAKQPVLVVPSAFDKADASVARFNSILVGVDFGHGSNAVVRKALSLAGENSRVTLLHVIPGGQPGAAARYMYRLMEPEYQSHVARDAWRRLSESVPADARTSRKVHARVATGDAAAEISRIAAEIGADVISVGVTRRGALGRLFGSTAARVIRTAGRPVLAIPRLMEQPTVPTSDRQFAVAA
jgi:nucleotide-binding universal stress UspA family protein